MRIDYMTQSRDIPTNESYFDIERDERIVAHISRPLVLDRDRRWTITIYNRDMTVNQTVKSFYPMYLVRRLIWK